ncbi:ABC transporter substrate-binding protein [Asticcacaulis taihuensis]|uniref:ABC transporter substrate-binding protein n=1 Tax=Asticcacaulis taihuensis TaxID=260084 RepID=UPI0026F03195|nr:ABC transporter substrate-binding protein [Asticcacaulis taihuensis]
MTVNTPLVPSDVVWVTRCPVPTATAIALNQGWFEDAYAEHGYKIQTLQDSRDPNIRAQHFYHDIKTLFREGGNVPAFWSRARNLKQKGHDRTAVIGLTWVDEVQLLLARPGSGITPQTLKGRTLGLSNAGGAVDIWRAMALRGYRAVLELAGLTYADITLKDLTAPHITWSPDRQRGGTWSPASEDALLNGEVDVIYAKGAPAIALKEKHGLDVVLDINSLEDPRLRINNGTPRPITVHRDLLTDAPELVALYLQVLNAASEWAKLNPDQVAGIIATETNTDAASVRLGYGPQLANSFDVALSEERIDAFQNQSDFLFGEGLIEAPVNVRDWIVREPLEAALNNPLSFQQLAVA